MLLLNPTHIKLCWPSCLIKQSRQWTRHLQFMNQMFYSATMIYSRTFTDDEQRCLTFCLTHTHTHTHTHTYSMNHQAHTCTGYGVKLQSSRTAVPVWRPSQMANLLLSIEVLHVLSAQGQLDCKYYCKNTEWNIYKAGVLTCPAEKQLTLRHSWVLKNPAAPSISEMALQYLSLFSLWLGPILCFYAAFSWSVFLCLLFDGGDGGAFFGSVVVCSPPPFTVRPRTYRTRWGK